MVVLNGKSPLVSIPVDKVRARPRDLYMYRFEKAVSIPVDKVRAGRKTSSGGSFRSAANCFNPRG